MKNFFDFDLCDNVRSRKQIIKHVKKRKMRKKHRKRIIIIFIFFRRFKSFSRKFIFIVRKQFVKKHNFIQYIHDINNVDYDISFSIRRFTKNIFLLKNSLRNQQLTFCKILQHKIIEQNKK